MVGRGGDLVALDEDVEVAVVEVVRAPQVVVTGAFALIAGWMQK